MLENRATSQLQIGKPDPATLRAKMLN